MHARTHPHILLGATPAPLLPQPAQEKPDCASSGADHAESTNVGWYHDPPRRVVYDADFQVAVSERTLFQEEAAFVLEHASRRPA